MHAFHLVIYLTGDRSMAHFKANFRKNIKKCATDCYFLSFFVIFATDLYYLFHSLTFNIYNNANLTVITSILQRYKSFASPQNLDITN